MSTVVVTGANRGIGLEFVRQYASDGAKVIACARDPHHAEALKELAAANSMIDVRPLDVSDFAACAALGRELGASPSTSSSTMPALTAPSGRMPMTWTSTAGRIPWP
jgi:NAD(P)-dependent dehydrogenase (short-subunit alcohol dehydrogenase family)